MWNDNDYASAGGFDVSNYDSSPSVSQGDSKQNRKPNSLFPVAVNQIINNTDSTMIISGYPVSMMSVVGIVRHVEQTSTKIIYTIQDWSGTISGMLWLEEGSDKKNCNVIENTYCRLTGTKREQDGKACLFIYDVVPIEDMSMLIFHYLQVIHIGLKADELRETPGNPTSRSTINQNINNADAGMSNLMLSDGLSLTPHQKSVYGILRSSHSECGIDKKDIFESLKSRVPLVEIQKALDFLTGEGHVYCTIDDEHFKVTDY